MVAEHLLYGRPGSGSSVCEAILKLSGLPFRIVDLERWPAGKAPAELLALNPLGQIPTFVLPDGTVMTESAAISLYLADLSPGFNLAPALDDALRPSYLRWMFYLASNGYMTALRIYYPDRYTTALEGGAAVKAAALLRSEAEWSIFSDALGEQTFILGERMSAADLYAAMLLSWEEDMEAVFKRHPGLKRMYTAVARQPVIASVWRRHGIPV